MDETRVEDHRGSMPSFKASWRHNTATKPDGVKVWPDVSSASLHALAMSKIPATQTPEAYRINISNYYMFLLFIPSTFNQAGPFPSGKSWNWLTEKW